MHVLLLCHLEPEDQQGQFLFLFSVKVWCRLSGSAPSVLFIQCVDAIHIAIPGCSNFSCLRKLQLSGRKEEEKEGWALKGHMPVVF